MDVGVGTGVGVGVGIIDAAPGSELPPLPPHPDNTAAVMQSMPCIKNRLNTLGPFLMLQWPMIILVFE